jgi:PiT family inorganic phosphate transporter
MFDPVIVQIAIVVVLALSFDFINGFHDTANTIATSISTKALPARVAIIFSAFMNLIGAMAFTGVAKTIGGKIADPLKLEHGMIIVAAALVAAITWNLVTWYFGIPSSSSHALIGSLAGSVIAAEGIMAVNYAGFITILEALVLSPVIAFIIGYLIMSLIRIVFKNSNPGKMNRNFRTLQIFTAAWQAFSHGTNDAQKSMGIITFALVAGGFQANLDVPFWVKVTCAVAMALGTSVGGYRIIKTIGTRIIKLEHYPCHIILNNGRGIGQAFIICPLVYSPADACSLGDNIAGNSISRFYVLLDCFIFILIVFYDFPLIADTCSQRPETVAFPPLL